MNKSIIRVVVDDMVIAINRRKPSARLVIISDALFLRYMCVTSVFKYIIIKSPFIRYSFNRYSNSSGRVTEEKKIVAR